MNSLEINKIENNLKLIKKEIENKCKETGRNPSEITLVAVSKTKPIEAIEIAYSLGIKHFGENYIQEFLEKKKALSHLKEIKWHIIGHCQTNKAKHLLEANFFHALDSIKLANKIAKHIEESNLENFPVFIEVNIDEEPTKSGIKPEEIENFSKEILKIPKLKLMGLMCIPKAQSSEIETKSSFLKLKNLSKLLPESAQALSMGMSHDYKLAIEMGATHIRIGQAIFGERQK
jgi:hypothetical protein